LTVLSRPAATPSKSRHRKGNTLRGGGATYLPRGICAVIGVAIVAGGHFTLPSALHSLVLFGHLMALVLGFGSVLAIEWFAVQWLAGRRTLASVLAIAGHLIPLTWGGLVALAVTGLLLSPDTSSPWTLLKLVLVLGLTVNGAGASTLRRQLLAAGHRPPQRLLDRAIAMTVASQICWWGAALIGFLNSHS